MTELMESTEYRTMYAVEERLWWYVALRRLLARCLHRYTQSGSRVLDAGCGTGINSMMMQSLGYEVVSIDLSPSAVAFSRKRGLRQVKLGSITKLPYKANSVQAVVCMDVLIMLTPTELATAIKEIERVLQPGGKVFIQVAAFEWLRSSHDDVCHVIKRYTLSEVQALFSTPKWKYIKGTYRIWCLFPLLAGIKLFKRLTESHNSVKQGDLWLPPKLINNVLLALQLVEDTVLSRFSLPWGTSIFLIVEKRTI